VCGTIYWAAEGTLADWTTAIIAGLALIVAGLAAKATIETNRAQQQSLELLRQQYERDQASKITFHVDWPKFVTKELDELLNDPHSPVSRWEGPRMLRLLNASNLPIYQICLIQTFPTDLEKPIVYRSDYQLPTGGEPDTYEIEFLLNEPVARYELYFTDVSGVRWIRGERGELRRASDTDLANVSKIMFAPFGLDEFGRPKKED